MGTHAPLSRRAGFNAPLQWNRLGDREPGQRFVTVRQGKAGFTSGPTEFRQSSGPYRRGRGSLASGRDGAFAGSGGTILPRLRIRTTAVATMRIPTMSPPRTTYPPEAGKPRNVGPGEDEEWKAID